MREVTLVIRTPGHEGTRILRSGAPPLTVGRDPAAGISIADKRVSWSHAWLWVDELGQVWVRDMGSMNGTGVDGARVDGQQKVGLGATVQIGSALQIEVQVATEREGDAEAWYLDDLGSGLRQPVVGDTYAFVAATGPTVTLTRKGSVWWLLGPGVAIPVEPGIAFGAGGRTWVLAKLKGPEQGTVGMDQTVT